MATRKPKQRPTLVLERTASCGTPLHCGEGHFIGTLTVGDLSVALDDGAKVGAVAFIVGAGKMDFKVPSLPGIYTLNPLGEKMPAPIEEMGRDKTPWNHEKSLTTRQQMEESLFIRRFLSVRSACQRSLTLNRHTVEWRQRELDEVMHLVPVGLRKRTVLPRATFDASGNVVRE